MFKKSKIKKPTQAEVEEFGQDDGFKDTGLIDPNTFSPIARKNGVYVTPKKVTGRILDAVQDEIIGIIPDEYQSIGVSKLRQITKGAVAALMAGVVGGVGVALADNPLLDGHSYYADQTSIMGDVGYKSGDDFDLSYQRLSINRMPFGVTLNRGASEQTLENGDVIKSEESGHKLGIYTNIPIIGETGDEDGLVIRLQGCGYKSESTEEKEGSIITKIENEARGGYTRLSAHNLFKLKGVPVGLKSLYFNKSNSNKGSFELTPELENLVSQLEGGFDHSYGEKHSSLSVALELGNHVGRHIYFGGGPDVDEINFGSDLGIYKRKTNSVSLGVRQFLVDDVRGTVYWGEEIGFDGNKTDMDASYRIKAGKTLGNLSVVYGECYLNKNGDMDVKVFYRMRVNTGGKK